MKEVVVGRSGDQWFKIDNNLHNTVHNRHAKITVRDDGTWWIEDLKGAGSNGTFVKEPGEETWRPVMSERISPTTLVRLSSFHSYIFMAHRVIQEPEDYSYELKVMLKLWKKYNDETAAVEAHIAKRKKLNTALTVGGLGVVVGTSVWGGIVGGLAGAGGIGSILMYSRMLLAPDSKKINELKLARQKHVVCPKCGRTMSDNDVNNLFCSICKCQ